MKIQTLCILTALLAFAALPVFAHTGRSQDGAQPLTLAATPAQAQPAAEVRAEAKKYTCPMHPEVITDKPGKCPKCGMTLVPVK